MLAYAGDLTNGLTRDEDIRLERYLNNRHGSKRNKVQIASLKNVCSAGRSSYEGLRLLIASLHRALLATAQRSPATDNLAHPNRRDLDHGMNSNARDSRTSSLGTAQIGAAATLQERKDCGCGKSGETEPQEGVRSLRLAAALSEVGEMCTIRNTVAGGVVLRYGCQSLECAQETTKAYDTAA